MTWPHLLFCACEEIAEVNEHAAIALAHVLWHHHDTGEIVVLGRMFLLGGKKDGGGEEGRKRGGEMKGRGGEGGREGEGEREEGKEVGRKEGGEK